MCIHNNNEKSQLHTRQKREGFERTGVLVDGYHHAEGDDKQGQENQLGPGTNQRTV